MRPSLRFLALAIAGWVGVRWAALDMLPGSAIFSIARSEAKTPPIAPTEFPPIEAIAPADPSIASSGYAPASIEAAGADPARPRAISVPVYYDPAVAPAHAPAVQSTQLLPAPRPAFYAPIPALDEWPLAHFAAASMPQRRSTVVLPGQSLPATYHAANRLDRVQLTAWALLRGQGAALASPTLATGGTLGASQAGARMTYNFTRQIAAALRTSSDVGRRGGEVAAGARIQPLGGFPLWITGERRQRLGSSSDGRNAFALFVEGGVYQRPMPLRFSLDAYFQGGVVGVNRPERFIDGSLTLTRPISGHLSGGFGVWGGAQPGLSRLDIGPRLTMSVRHTMRVHLDWRQRVTGNARPASGPALTVAGDF